MKLFVVFSKFKDDGIERNYVYAVQSADEARDKFLSDWNNRQYQEITGIYQIDSKVCVVNYQLGREVFDFTEHEYYAFPTESGGYKIQVDNIPGYGTVMFDPLYTHAAIWNTQHGKECRLDLMICIADGRQNWIYVEDDLKKEDNNGQQAAV